MFYPHNTYTIDQGYYHQYLNMTKVLLAALLISLTGVVVAPDPADVNHWTDQSVSGCECPWDASSECACCTDGGCHCPIVTYPRVCVKCDSLLRCPDAELCHVIADGECYYFGEHTKKPWEKALSYCEALAPCTSLAAPLTEAAMTALVDKAKAINWPTVWLAGSEETGREWRWASPHDRGTLLQTQGCYSSEGILDYVAEESSDITPFTCNDACSYKGYHLSSVQMVPATVIVDQQVVACHCGDYIHPGYQVQWNKCDMVCPTSTEDYCGGINYQMVRVATANEELATYTNWVQPPSQPDGHCAVLAPKLKWKTKRCLDYFDSICQYPDTGSCDKKYIIDGTCVSKERLGRTWYEARSFCQSRGGDLVRITTSSIQAEISKMMGSSNDSHYWIGLSNRQWYWHPGQWQMPILDWKNGDPISNPEGYDSCMMMHEDTSYQWCSKKCTQKHHFICQIGDAKRITTSPAVNTGPLMGTTVPESVSYQMKETDSPLTENVSPPSQHHTTTPAEEGDSSNVKQMVIGIVIGVAVSLLLVILIVGAIFLIKRRKKTETSTARTTETAENMTMRGSTNYNYIDSERQSNVYESLEPYDYTSTGYTDIDGHKVKPTDDVRPNATDGVPPKPTKKPVKPPFGKVVNQLNNRHADNAAVMNNPSYGRPEDVQNGQYMDMSGEHPGGRTGYVPTSGGNEDNAYDNKANSYLEVI